MDINTIIVLVIIAVALVWTIMLYNNLVTIKHNVSKAWSNIDVLLKQRHDELPKLVETCKQYKQFEQDTLEKVMQARSQVASARASHDIPALGQAEGALRLPLPVTVPWRQACVDARLGAAVRPGHGVVRRRWRARLLVRSVERLQRGRVGRHRHPAAATRSG